MQPKKVPIDLHVAYYRQHPSSASLWMGGRTSPTVTKHVHLRMQTLANRLHDILVEASKGPAMQTFYSTTGTDPFTTTPAELGKFQIAESEKWKNIIKKAGIEPE